MGSNLWSCKFLLATKGSNPSSVLLIVPSVRFTLVSFMPAAGWKKMTEEEVRLANAWYTEDGLPPSAIAERLGRDKSVLTRLLVKQVPQKKQGRPPSLSQAQVTYLKRLLDKMVRKADCKYTVTAAMLKKAAKLKVGERVIRDALHQQKVYFRKLREKLVLTPEDVKDRLAFARKYHGKTPGWWNKHLHAIIDGKSFKVYLNADGRKKAAQHATYGAYRAPGHVKPNKNIAHQPRGPKWAHSGSCRQRQNDDVAQVCPLEWLPRPYTWGQWQKPWKRHTQPSQSSLSWRTMTPVASSHLRVWRERLRPRSMPSRFHVAALTWMSWILRSGRRSTDAWGCRSRSGLVGIGRPGDSTWPASDAQPWGSQRLSSPRALGTCTGGANDCWQQKVALLRKAGSSIPSSFARKRRQGNDWWCLVLGDCRWLPCLARPKPIGYLEGGCGDSLCVPWAMDADGHAFLDAQWHWSCCILPGHILPASQWVPWGCASLSPHGPLWRRRQVLLAEPPALRLRGWACASYPTARELSFAGFGEEEGRPSGRLVLWCWGPATSDPVAVVWRKAILIETPAEQCELHRTHLVPRVSPHFCHLQREGSGTFAGESPHRIPSRASIWAHNVAPTIESAQLSSSLASASVRQPYSGMPALLRPACAAIWSNLNAPGPLNFNSKTNDLTS